ncbi:MAG: hypothetical protein RBS53_06660 [Bacteroidales bacterium]|nr:hypothetical protein [Bacteroidales bacterium]NLM92843.1 hypothetical protein [Bacteroidales bacterium]
MKRRPFLILTLVFSTFLFSGLTACKSDNHPGKKDLRLVLEDHFNRPIYKGYVEVLDVKVLEDGEAEYMGGQYYDVRISARIRVKKGFVVSKRFTATTFEVNEEWPGRYQKDLAEAKTEEEREEIDKLFNANTFSEGEHEIEGMLGFALLEGKWHLLSLMLGPQAPKSLAN